MRLENAFTVPAPVDRAWAVLLDVERVAPCLPGAALDGGDGTEFSGAMTIKLGPVTTRYQGTVRIEEADRAGLRAVLRAQARDARGDGGAAATITTRLEPAGAGTRVNVMTDMTISGPAAQFGRGVMQDVSSKLMRQFADCLAEEMAADGELGGDLPAADDVAPREAGARYATSTSGADGIAYEETAVGRLPLGPAGDAALAAARTDAPARPRARRSAEVLDLGAASRGAVARRVAPVALGAVAVAAGVAWLRRRR